MTDRLGQVLDSTRALLLDFDGPVCHTFAGYPASEIADMLRAFLKTEGVAIPHDLQGPDPLELFRQVAIAHPDLSTDVENRLIDAERTAVRTAKPTPYAHDLICAAARSGVAVAIVSNNSAAAIGDYLDQHGLTDRIATVVGRPYGQPRLMKPNPHSVVEALVAVGAHPHECAFVGDSVSDVEAAQRAHTRSIGYAKDPSRIGRLTSAGADVVVESIGELAGRWDSRQ